MTTRALAIGAAYFVAAAVTPILAGAVVLTWWTHGLEDFNDHMEWMGRCWDEGHPAVDSADQAAG